MTLRITWAIVSYGNPEQALDLARSLTSLSTAVEVLIGCNGRADFEWWSANVPVGASARIKAVDSRHNPGYIGFLAEEAANILEDSVVVLSNADLCVEPEFFGNLESAIANFPDAAVFAPAIAGASGMDQNPHLIEPPSRRKLRTLRAVHRFPPIADVLLAIRGGGHSARSGLPGLPGEPIYAGHGSCMIFSPIFRQLGGTFDYPMFLFGEELWVATEAQRIGARIRYIPECKMTHEEHATTGSRRRGMVAAAKYDSLKYWSTELTRAGGRRSV